MDRRRKQVALSFLTSISVDGKPAENRRKTANEAGFPTPPSVRLPAAASGDLNSCKEENGDQTSSVKTSVLDGEHKTSVLGDIHRKCCTTAVRPRSIRRVHFIKNMRQHDTRNGRLDCEHQKAFGGLTSETVTGIDAVNPGVKSKLLSNTNAPSGTADVFAMHYGSQCVLSPANNVVFQNRIRRGLKGKSIDNYDPNLLDDPQWPCGKHKRVLVFPSYITTFTEYVKPSDLKKDMNQTFSEKFPHVHLTLSKIRSLKREIRKLAQEDCGYEESTIAVAYVYFEKLVLGGKLNKQNRKLCAGVCILLAAKISNDLKKPDVKHLIDRLEEKLRLNRRDLLSLEFPVLVALEFQLHLPQREVQPHYRRLMQSQNY